MSILDSQTFSGTANPIGGRWTTTTGQNAMQSVSGNMTGSTGAAFNGAYNTNVTPPNDQYCKLVYASGSPNGGPCVRVSTSADTYYQFSVESTTVGFIKKHVAGTETSIGTAFLNTTIVAGDVIEVRAVGTTISAWQNGSQCASTTDSSIASGNFGVATFGTAIGFSSFEGGDFLSGAVLGPDFYMKPQSVLSRL